MPGAGLARRNEDAKLRAVFRPITLTVLTCAWLLLASCGDDDDASQTGGDGGPGGSTKPDAQAHGGSGGKSGSRDGGARDSGAVDAGDAGDVLPTCPVGECDLLDDSSCGDGKNCLFKPI